MISFKKLSILIFTLIFTFNFTYANSYYVDSKDGNNNNSGTSANFAFRTIEKVESILVPGDVVYLAPGIYTSQTASSSLNLTKNGSADKPITFIGSSDSSSTITSAGNSINVRVSGSYRVFKNIVFDADSKSVYSVYEDTYTKGNEYYNVIVKNSLSTGMISFGLKIIKDSKAINNKVFDFDMRRSSFVNPQVFDNIGFESTNSYGLRAANDRLTVQNIKTTFHHNNTLIDLVGVNNSIIRNLDLRGDSYMALVIRAGSPASTASNNLVEDVKVVTTRNGGGGIFIGSDSNIDGYNNVNNNTVRRARVFSENKGVTSFHSIFFGFGKNNRLENSYVEGGAFGFADKESSNSVIVNNIFFSGTPYWNNLYIKGAKNGVYENNLFIDDSTSTRPAIQINPNTSDPSLPPSYGSVIKNNVVVAKYTQVIGTDNLSNPATTNFFSDYNLYDYSSFFGNIFQTLYNSLDLWKKIGINDQNSIKSIYSKKELVYSIDPNMSIPEIFRLFDPESTSTVIDVGSFSTSSSVDSFGRSIYGPRDNGPLEYQPKLILGIDMFRYNESIRAYGGDNRFRVLKMSNSTSTSNIFLTRGTTTLDYTDFFVEKGGGEYSIYATSSATLNDTNVFINGLQPQSVFDVVSSSTSFYQVVGTGCDNTRCTADASGSSVFKILTNDNSINLKIIPYNYKSISFFRKLTNPLDGSFVKYVYPDQDGTYKIEESATSSRHYIQKYISVPPSGYFQLTFKVKSNDVKFVRGLLLDVDKQDMLRIGMLCPTGLQTSSPIKVEGQDSLLEEYKAVYVSDGWTQCTFKGFLNKNATTTKVRVLFDLINNQNSTSYPGTPGKTARISDILLGSNLDIR